MKNQKSSEPRVYALSGVVAKIRKGGPKINGKLGNNLDYLRLSVAPGFEHIERRFHAVYGEMPRVIKAHLFYPTRNENWYNMRTLHQKNRLTRVCDGETVHHHVNQRFVSQRNPIPCAMKPDADTCPMGCRQACELYVRIDGLEMATPVAICVTSKNEISWIEKLLDTIEEMTLGNFMDICPIIIERKKMTITKKFVNPDTKEVSTKREDEWMVTMQIDPDWNDPLIQHRRAMRLEDLMQSRGLPSGMGAAVFGLKGGPAMAALPAPEEEPDHILVAAVEDANRVIDPPKTQPKPPTQPASKPAATPPPVADLIEDDDIIDGEEGEGGEKPAGEKPDINEADRTLVSSLLDRLTNLKDDPNRDKIAAKFFNDCKNAAKTRDLNPKLSGKGAYTDACTLVNACVDHDAKLSATQSQEAPTQ